MSNYVQMTGTVREDVLFVNFDAPRNCLHDCLEQRVGAANDLLMTASCIGHGSADFRDVANVASAAQLLLQDAIDLLRAVRHAELTEGSTNG